MFSHLLNIYYINLGIWCILLKKKDNYDIKLLSLWIYTLRKLHENTDNCVEQNPWNLLTHKHILDINVNRTFAEMTSR